VHVVALHGVLGDAEVLTSRQANGLAERGMEDCGFRPS
jgi:hypothetical protein